MDGLAVGIDVTFAKRKSLPLVVARDADGRVTPIERGAFPRKPPIGQGNRVLAMGPAQGAADPVTVFADATADLLDETAALLGEPIIRIAIDAPRGPAPAGRLRASEQAMADAGLSFIQTPPDLERIRATARASAEAGAPDSRLREANRLWMIVGVRLFEVLGERFGHDRIIEVYPYAAFERLGGAGIVKGSASGSDERLRALVRYAGWDDVEALRGAVHDATWGAMHDKVDAYLCAVLAARSQVADSFEGADVDPLDRIWMPAS